MDYNKSYKQAGVDVTAGYEAVRLMKPHISRTAVKGVLSDMGGFGGLFMPDLTGMDEPVLVSGTDGVGTKLKMAFIMDKHDTIGIDCVAMCANDIICCGAKPLFFLDYIACGKNHPEKTAEIVKGIADGCVQAGCALIGGETAEHPGMMPEDEYDLAGFCVGIADKKDIIGTAPQRPGDVIIGIPSSGIHSNGFSLIRRVFDLKSDYNKYIPELGKTLGEELLTPTRIYAEQMKSLTEVCVIKSAAHITGGGFYENIPRAVSEGLSVKIDGGSLRVPPVFDFIAHSGKIPREDMLGTFNMGIGFCVIADKNDAAKVLELCGDAYVIGELAAGDREITIM